MLGQLGGLGVLDLEGVWTRYDDPEPLLAEIASLPASEATRRMQELYAEPIKPELVRDRLAEIREAGVTVAGSLTPQRTQELYETVVAAGVDLFVIRGTTVSAEHVSSVDAPLNLKKFIYDLDVPVIVGGASTYTAALHLMRTGAAGVLVGFGGGGLDHPRDPRHPRADGDGRRRRRRRAPRLPRRVGRPLRARHRRRRRRHVGRHRQGARDGRGCRHARRRARARDRRARPRLPLGPEAHHPKLRAASASRSDRSPAGGDPLRPRPVADGTANLIGALKKSMATTGYSDLKEFQRVEVVVAPYMAGR
jgi:IMP dehydrogenase